MSSEAARHRRCFAQAAPEGGAPHLPPPPPPSRRWLPAPSSSSFPLPRRSPRARLVRRLWRSLRVLCVYVSCVCAHTHALRVRARCLPQSRECDELSSSSLRPCLSAEPSGGEFIQVLLLHLSTPHSHSHTSWARRPPWPHTAPRRSHNSPRAVRISAAIDHVVQRVAPAPPTPPDPRLLVYI